ncbi:hypothetical protein L3Q82_011229 [Scortum barcoo]|uniref:Uncharacterized protein n=1 Tax=Scortum barcoo TaxID=214431 RepID=A0ACB8W9K9_9TELE|nr:hypothetical protein L3Q82_011229 [Scortum barcoo]
MGTGTGASAWFPETGSYSCPSDLWLLNGEPEGETPESGFLLLGITNPLVLQQIEKSSFMQLQPCFALIITHVSNENGGLFSVDVNICLFLCNLQISQPPEEGHSKVMPFNEVWEKSMCQPMEQLVDVEQEYPEDVEYIYLPACVPLRRCSGCCVDENLECQPALERNVTLEVKRIHPMMYMHSVELTFVEHQTCICRCEHINIFIALCSSPHSSSGESIKNRPRRRKHKKTANGCGNHCECFWSQGFMAGREMSTKRKAESHSRAANRPRLMKSQGSRADSERDSGFSDASSEHTSTMDTTDSEDSPRPVAQQGPQASGSGPRTSQLAVVGGSYSSLSPMIIMNNVLLKQPGDNPPALKPWGFSPTVEVVQPVVQQPQVVFIQPVVSRQPSPASKETSSRHRHRPKKYLPILKSYPKIAPHPGDSSSSSGRGTALSSSSSSSASSSSGSERGSSLTSSHQEHREKQKKILRDGASKSGSTTPRLPATPSAVSPLLQRRLSLHTTETSANSSPTRERPSSAVSQAEFTTPLSLTNTTASKNQTLPAPLTATQANGTPGVCTLSDSDADTKRKRFCNTYNILSKSGLLDIALRTKELHRQNRRTQNDLDQLKEHTDLFLQALLSGDTSICVKLQARLLEEDREKERERTAQTSLKAD